MEFSPRHYSQSSSDLPQSILTASYYIPLVEHARKASTHFRFIQPMRYKLDNMPYCNWSIDSLHLGGTFIPTSQLVENFENAIFNSNNPYVLLCGVGARQLDVCGHQNYVLNYQSKNDVKRQDLSLTTAEMIVQRNFIIQFKVCLLFLIIQNNMF